MVLAINYRPEVMMGFISEWQEKLGVKITCSQETEPMGTAGPLALAKHILDDGSGNPFFVLNSDVICEYPLAAMLDFHKARGAESTILVTKVDDPTKYGVVVMDSAGLVERFVEKPKEFVGDKINAGIYVCSPSILNRIQMRPMSIEREVFPHVAVDNKLYAFTLSGYWMGEEGVDDREGGRDQEGGGRRSTGYWAGEGGHMGYPRSITSLRLPALTPSSLSLSLSLSFMQTSVSPRITSLASSFTWTA